MFTPYEPTPEQPWNVRRIVHLHRRAGFAASWGEIQRDLMDGPEAAVTRLLRTGPDSQQGRAGEPNREFEQLSSVVCDAAIGSGDINRLKAWWLYRMLFSPDSLGERLTLMWHNHFATSNVKVANVGLMQEQNAIFRQFARAPFGEVLRRVAKHPALLVWLDADANRKEHPNENLAREMMELFSLGAGNFSENDVKQAARALTGWSVTRDKFRSFDQYHDDGEKTIFGQSGKWTGDDLVRMLLDHPAMSRRLAYRLCELFMGEKSATTEVIDQLANGLRERELDIAWVVETLLRSEEFFSDNNIGNRVLGPIEFVIGAARSLEIMDPPPSTLLLAEQTAKLGQDLFIPPNVFGWPGGRSWLTSRTVIGRANFATALVNGELHGRSTPFDAARLAQSHGFTSNKDMGSFFAQLLLGQQQLPAELKQYVDTPNQLVAAILASPAAQLA